METTSPSSPTAEPETTQDVVDAANPQQPDATETAEAPEATASPEAAETDAPAAPPPHHPSWRWRYAFLPLVALLGWLAFTSMNVWWGELNQDEGWYLYAARELRAGHMPYRDFAFTQPPMLPLVYAVAYAWVTRLGLLGARCLTAGFGLLAILASGWLAMRTGPRSAQRLSLGLCAALAGLNIYQSYFTTIVKTYALASAFLAWGLVLLSCVSDRHAVRAAFASGFLLVCALATRVSLAPAFVLGWGYLIVSSRRLKPWAWLDYLLGAALAGSLIVVPFYLMGRDGFLFGLVEYHTLRTAGPLLSRLVLKAGTLVRLLQAYFPAVLATITLLGLVVWDARKRRILAHLPATDASAPAAVLPPSALADTRPSVLPAFTPFLWLILAAIFVVHLSAPFPYDDYQVPIYPIFAAAISAAITRRWILRETAALAALPAANTPHAIASRRTAALWSVIAFSVLYALASPIAQGWFVAGRDRVWWKLREQSPIAQLRDQAQWIRNMTLAAGGTALLTQDTYLAVEADLDVLPGFEMGPFSYYPDWTAERAAACHVHNRESLRDAIRTVTNAPVAALSGYSLAIACPEVRPIDPNDDALFRAILADRYDHVEDIPHFGQASTTLSLWRIKTAGLPPDEAATVAALSDAAALTDALLDPFAPATDAEGEEAAATSPAPPSSAEPLAPFTDTTLSDGPDPTDPAAEFAAPPP